MKNKIFNILTFVSIAIGLYSCSTTAIIETPIKNDYKMRTADYKETFINKNDIYQKPLVADLEVSKQKVSMSRTYENMTVDQAKENITGEFMIEQGCDILVQPLYQTETTYSNNNSTITVSVTGYPAFYKNIRTYSPDDAEAFMIKSIVGSVKSSTVDKPNTSVAVSIQNKVNEVKKVVNKTTAFFELGAEASSPLGDFGESYDLGYGFYSKLGLKVSKGINIHTDFSLLSYGGKTVNSYKIPAFNVFRYMGGLDFKLIKGLHGSLQAGISNIKVQDYKESDFTYNVGLGYMISKVDFNIFYNSMAIENPVNTQTANNSVGLRLGYRF